MKAVVTIIDDDGIIICKDRVLMPIREGIATPAFVKYARFVFEISTVIRPDLFKREEAAADGNNIPHKTENHRR